MTAQQLKPIEPSQEVATRPQPVTPMEMVFQAVTNNSSVEVVEKLMGLHERWQANQARMAFDQAMADAKAKIPVITKRSNVKYDVKDKGTGGNSPQPKPEAVDFDYETLGDIATAINPILSESGLSYRYRSKQENGLISVTCIVTHREGHCEETTLAAGADTSGKKNGIQSIGSTVSYLQRYTLKLALGLAAAKDDDGKTAEPPETVSEENANRIFALLDETSTSAIEFCRHFKIDKVGELPSSRLKEAMNIFAAKKKKQGAGNGNS